VGEVVGSGEEVEVGVVVGLGVGVAEVVGATVDGDINDDDTEIL
jgi:hypothetical protein